tara:strand:- start:338 stop:496 length:159 start_codon:yes stop_codon:yes gene_type:complete
MVRLTPKSKPQKKAVVYDIDRVNWLINNNQSLIEENGKYKFSGKNNGEKTSK